MIIIIVIIIIISISIIIMKVKICKAQRLHITKHENSEKLYHKLKLAKLTVLLKSQFTRKRFRFFLEKL